jgi:hypothetical protein
LSGIRPAVLFAMAAPAFKIPLKGLQVRAPNWPRVHSADCAC